MDTLLQGVALFTVEWLLDFPRTQTNNNGRQRGMNNARDLLTFVSSTLSNNGVGGFGKYNGVHGFLAFGFDPSCT
jgi:hypothetical protein